MNNEKINRNTCTFGWKSRFGWEKGCQSLKPFLTLTSKFARIVAVQTGVEMVNSTRGQRSSISSASPFHSLRSAWFKFDRAVPFSDPTALLDARGCCCLTADLLGLFFFLTKLLSSGRRNDGAVLPTAVSSTAAFSSLMTPNDSLTCGGVAFWDGGPDEPFSVYIFVVAHNEHKSFKCYTDAVPIFYKLNTIRLELF